MQNTEPEINQNYLALKKLSDFSVEIAHLVVYTHALSLEIINKQLQLDAKLLELSKTFPEIAESLVRLRESVVQ